MGQLYELPVDTVPRFLVVGVGPHAKRTYIPHLIGFEKEGRAELVVAVELEQNRDALLQYSLKACPNVELLFVPAFTSRMPEEVAVRLSMVVRRLRITHVIIATEPRAHRAYGLWALGHGLDIIMDKPLTTRQNVVFDRVEAYGIAQDYMDLWMAYKSLQKRRRTIFLVNCQRRYHPGFQFTLEMLEDIRAKTGAPVTNIISTHCDGQWRLPSEIVDIDYHGFNEGYGKVSHSGYHILDCIHLFYQAGISAGKQPDRIEVISSFIQPNGFFKTLNTSDYSRLFGDEEYDAARKYSDSELRQRFQDFGELDASIQITFFLGKEAICLAQVNLQHNGFSRRHWIQPNADLYKGNGRVKHEFHEIKNGPFQTVVVDSRQANDKHDKSKPTSVMVGSDNHFEVQVFRNSDILGEEQPLQVFGVADIDAHTRSTQPGLLSENVKRGILEDALGYYEGTKAASELKSNLADHCVPVFIMSAVYLSHIQRTAGQDPIVALDISYDHNNVATAEFSDSSLWAPKETGKGEKSGKGEKRGKRRIEVKVQEQLQVPRVA